MSEKSNWAIVVLTVGLLAVAYTQERDTDRQWKVATQALEESQTPHIKLWINRFSGIDTPGSVQAWGNIENRSQVTLFNAKVYVALGYATEATMSTIWQNMTFRGKAVLGPSDQETYLAQLSKLSAEEIQNIKARKGFIVAATLVEFPDPAGRTHHRNICARWWWDGEKMVEDTCDGPDQN